MRRSDHRIARNGQYCYVGLVLFAKLLDFFCGKNLVAPYGLSYLFPVGIEQSDKVNAATVEFHVVCKRKPHVAETDDYRLCVSVRSEQMFYFRKQIFYVVTVTLLSEPAEAVQVLPYLRRGNIHLFAEFFRRYPRNAGKTEFVKVSEVSRKPFDDRRRNVSVLHFSLLFRRNIFAT